MPRILYMPRPPARTPDQRHGSVLSRKSEKLRAEFSLYVAWFNWYRRHATIKKTPSVATGLAAEESARPMGYWTSLMQFPVVRQTSVAPPGLVYVRCLGSTGSRPWLSAQVPPGPRVDRRSGSRKMRKHCINRHLNVPKDVYSGDLTCTRR